MSYYSDDETERRLKALEAELTREYRYASAEMAETWEKYINGWDEYKDGKDIHHKSLAERYAEEYQAYLNGDYTKAEFDLWYKTQIKRGEGYEAMAEMLADRAVNSNLIAEALINDTTPGIYSLNYNYEAYRISEAYGIDFHLHDEQTLKELFMGGNHIEFKTVKLDPIRDYAWNSDQINKALLAGILQGKSIDELADAYMSVMERNRNAAIRNARTSVTSAQNAGRIESYNRAQEMGIELEKEWMATLDNRTRDTHKRMDGERVANKARFSNKLLYPGDPRGEPKEVYNCRCTMRAVLPGKNDKTKLSRAYKGADGHREYEKDGTPKTLKNATYTGKDKTLSFQDWINKKGANYAKAEELFKYSGNELYRKYPRYKIDEVIANLRGNEVGAEIAKYIEENDIRVKLNCEPQTHSNRGISYRHATEIEIFTTNTGNNVICEQSIVHEATHLEYDIGKCQHAEAICYARELMYEKGEATLTAEEWNRCVEWAKKQYSWLEWEEGGYGKYEKFNFVK